jgi:hypothetical protein
MKQDVMDRPWWKWRREGADKRIIWRLFESNLRLAVNKTSNGEKILYAKNTYIFKPLLNVVSAGIEALIVSGNKFLHACVKAVCRLWAQPRFDTFHQLLIIIQELLSQPLLQVGTQVIVTSEISAVRMVVKQLPVEILQRCSNAISCMRTRIIMEEH